MTRRLQSLWRRFRNLHDDENGMEAIQVVAIVAIAAIVLIFVKTFLWPMIRDWAGKKTDELVQ